ncbi:MAG: cation diffusion facilitator family transporter [Thaumarchaeota archaeon]|nr:cation diffusion facilitator family transporter [Nitrososphaerota archaeon]
MFVHRTRVLQISLIAIFSAFLVELVFGLHSNSLALITDSIHALLDCVVTGILLLAARMALKPPDSRHTYGHGKIESLGGLFGGIAIFLIAIYFIYESINRLQSPPPTIIPGFFAVIGGAYTIGVDCFRIILLKKSIKKIGGTTLKADYYHAFMDLGSTLVAIIGIIFAAYGFYSGDFLAALVLGGLLAVLSIKLIYKTAQDLTDIISPEMVNRVKKIVANTDGVVGINAVLMRRSGETTFADITISLRADASFDLAHEISDRVEENIKNEIPRISAMIHFEPSWENVPVDAKIYEIANNVSGVMGVHNVSTHKIDKKTFASLHVMVDRQMSLLSAHKISEMVEYEIQHNIAGIEHATIHLEPYTVIPDNFEAEDKASELKIRDILKRYYDVKKIGRIASLRFGGILRIDIDCSFEKNATIEDIHDLVSEIEHVIRSEFKNAVITIHPEPS